MGDEKLVSAEEALRSVRHNLLASCTDWCTDEFPCIACQAGPVLEDLVKERDAAIARAEQAERERDETEQREDSARNDADVLRDILGEVEAERDRLARERDEWKGACTLANCTLRDWQADRDRVYRMERDAVVSFLRAGADGAHSSWPMARDAMRKSLTSAANLIEKGAHMEEAADAAREVTRG